MHNLQVFGSNFGAALIHIDILINSSFLTLSRYFVFSIHHIFKYLFCTLLLQWSFLYLYTVQLFSHDWNLCVFFFNNFYFKCYNNEFISDMIINGVVTFWMKFIYLFLSIYIYISKKSHFKKIKSKNNTRTFYFTLFYYYYFCFQVELLI